MAPGELGAGRVPYRHVCICVVHGKHCRLWSETSWYLSCGNIFSRVELGRPEPGLPPCSSTNISRYGPLLSLTSPPRPPFCSANLPNPCWSTLRIGQPSTCYQAKESCLNVCSHLLWQLWWDTRVYTKPPKSRPPNLST